MKLLKAIIPAAVLLTPACAAGVQSDNFNTGKGAVVPIAVNVVPPEKVKKNETEKEKLSDLRKRADEIQARIMDIVRSGAKNAQKVDECSRNLPVCETFIKEAYGALDRNPKAVAKCDALGPDTKEWSDCLVEVGKNDPIQLEAAFKCGKDVLACIGE